MAMSHNPLREERQHRRIQELIPWYVNGTLAAEERQTVEAHVASCGRCHGELTAAAEMAKAIREAGEVAPSPHPVQLSRLFARIDAHAAGAMDADAADAADAAEAAEVAPLGDGDIVDLEPPPVPAGNRFAARFDFTPRRMRRLLAAELAAILALAAILGWHLRAPAAPAAGAAGAPAEYHTLSSDAPVAVAPGTAPLRVLFAEGATAARIQQLLAGIRGQITAGPSPVGAYVVAVPVGPGADPVDLVLAHLRAQPEVSFAERVAGGGVP
jgi:hypothetical protein